VARIKPAPTPTDPGLHPALATSNAILGHLPGVKEAIDTWMSSLREAGSLPPRLVELVRIRVAFHNQCRTCMAVRYLPDEVDEDLVCSLERPAESDDLTEAERAALGFADLFATNHLAIDDAVYEDLRRFFTEPELVELGVLCAYLVGIGRLSATWDAIDDLPETFTATQDGPVTPWGHREVVAVPARR
jgi:alkylhydroperoxidase family enzyme